LILNLSLEHNVSQKEAREKAEIVPPPTCHRCGKEIPKGNYAFCPSCGTALER
jgi:rRNA maturation endonuclease Nob1